jgi:glycosyltransferase involved in cell wall biosynthesis
VSGGRFSIVCCSTQNWRSALPTNRHQIMLRAARAGHEVLFVETGDFLGTHLLRLVRSGFDRSLARRLLGTEEALPGVRVRKALNVLPWGQKYRLANRANCAVTAFALRRDVRRLPVPAVLWLYDPCAAGLAGRLGEHAVAYDCVDDYPEQAGPNPRRRSFVARCDEEAARAADVAFATTPTLLGRLLERNPSSHLVPNVGDFAHFSPAADRALAEPDAAALPRPVVGFAGNFHPAKVDFDLLERVAEARPGWTILLVGPTRPGAGEALARLARRPNVRWLGPRAYEELPRALAAFDVAVIPYLANDYTRSCFPLKLYEYLAAGKPVVASGLPSLAGMEPDVRLGDGPDAFVAAVEQALEDLGPESAARRAAVAAGHTWEERTSTLLRLVGQALEREEAARAVRAVEAAV